MTPEITAKFEEYQRRDRERVISGLAISVGKVADGREVTLMFVTKELACDDTDLARDVVEHVKNNDNPLPD